MMAVILGQESRVLRFNGVDIVIVVTNVDLYMNGVIPVAVMVIIVDLLTIIVEVGIIMDIAIIITIEGSMMIILRDILINNIGRKMEER